MSFWCPSLSTSTTRITNCCHWFFASMRLELRYSNLRYGCLKSTSWQRLVVVVVNPCHKPLKYRYAICIVRCMPISISALQESLSESTGTWQCTGIKHTSLTGCCDLYTKLSESNSTCFELVNLEEDICEFLAPEEGSPRLLLCQTPLEVQLVTESLACQPCTFLFS